MGRGAIRAKKSTKGHKGKSKDLEKIEEESPGKRVCSSVFWVLYQKKHGLL